MTSTHASSACIIETAFVKKTVPVEYKAFMKTFSKKLGDEYSFEDFAEEAAYSQDLLEVAPVATVGTYEDLLKAFRKKTKLELSVIHISDEDDREHEGVYWIVLNAKVYTPAAKKIQKHLSDMHYLIYC